LAESGKRIAVCIDDFGLHAGINEAAVRLAQHGRATAISCMVGAPNWREGATELKALPREQVDIGLHLDLTECPVLPGARRSLSALIALSNTRLLDRRAVRSEIDAQLDAFESGLGRAPDYVDGHQHAHQFPVVRDALIDALLRRYPQQRPWLRYTGIPRALHTGVKSRVIEQLGCAALARTARKHGFAQNAHLLGVYDFNGDAARYLQLMAGWLAAASEGDLLMCHVSTPSAARDGLLQARCNEYTVLAGDGFSELLARSGVEVTTLSRITATGYAASR
jgi:chitin disaccharide deacetylase